MLRILLASAAALLLAAVWGCGSSGQITVQGTVTVNGQPLESGVVALTSVDGRGATAGTPIERGSFHLQAKGLVPGEYKVAINAFRKTGKKTWDGMGEPNAPASQKHYVEETEQYIPARYNDATELTATLKAGATNDLKFDLQAPARK
jgi:hypothetical protein